MVLPLVELVERGRVLIVSPYTNFNVVLALEVVKGLTNAGRRVCLRLEHGLERAEVTITEGSVGGSNNLLIGECREAAELSVMVVDRGERCNECPERCLCVVSSPLPSERRLRQRDWLRVRVRAVAPGLYVLVGRGLLQLVALSGSSLVPLGIPDEVLTVCREVEERASAFGSVRASHLLRYLVKVRGFTRGRALSAIRRAIAVGVVGYAGGLLYPRVPCSHLEGGGRGKPAGQGPSTL